MSDEVKKYRHPDLKVGDLVYGPYVVKNAAGERVKMTVKAIDTNAEMSRKIKLAQGEDVRHVVCSYTLHDAYHEEEYREDSLTKI